MGKRELPEGCPEGGRAVGAGCQSRNSTREQRNSRSRDLLLLQRDSGTLQHKHRGLSRTPKPHVTLLPPHTGKPLLFGSKTSPSRPLFCSAKLTCARSGCSTTRLGGWKGQQQLTESRKTLEKPRSVRKPHGKDRKGEREQKAHVQL